MTRIELAEGKYTYINDNGNQRALRYGEEWRDLTGDNLIYYMGVEIQQLKLSVEQLCFAINTGTPIDEVKQDPRWENYE